MATKNQIQPGKTQANLVVPEQVHETVKKAAEAMNMSISDIYAQGAMTFLNNGRRPITEEEIFARNVLHDVPREKWVYVRAMGFFLAVKGGSVNQSRLSMLRTALGKFFDKAEAEESKNAKGSTETPQAIRAIA